MTERVDRGEEEREDKETEQGIILTTSHSGSGIIISIIIIMDNLSRVSFVCSTGNTQGRSRTAHLLLKGSPEASASYMALAKWVKELWLMAGGRPRTGTSLPTLLGYYRAVSSSPPSFLGEVRGPIGAMLLEAARLGWSLSSDGTTITLADGEAHVGIKAKAAYRDKALGSMGSRLGMGGPASIEPIAAVLASTTSPRERYNIETFASSAIWTNDRLASAGYLIQGTYDKCGLQDSVRHRLYVCLDDDVCKARQGLDLPTGLLEEGQADDGPS